MYTKADYYATPQVASFMAFNTNPDGIYDDNEDAIMEYLHGAQFHRSWKLAIHWKWRMVSLNQGGIGAAWPKDVMNKLTFEEAA